MEKDIPPNASRNIRRRGEHQVRVIARKIIGNFQPQGPVLPVTRATMAPNLQISLRRRHNVS